MSSKEFEKLESFGDPKAWIELSVEEKELLAHLFVLKGENLLEDGDGQAIESFRKANNLCPDNPKLLYRQALALFNLGKLSGEPQDYKNSISLFKKAARLGFSTSVFWNDYACAINQIAFLINKPEMLVEAVEMLWKSIKITPTYQEGWYNLATFLKTLYQMHPQDAYYTLSNESFDQLSKIDPHNHHLWIEWGDLLVHRARLEQDIQILLEGCKKFEAADICEPNHPLILSAWTEALLLVGTWNEDQSILKTALNKICGAIELQKDLPSLWRLYGDCLLELGKYHRDEEFLIRAIEKYRVGLKMDSAEALLWYGLSLSLYTLGQFREDITLVEEASRHFAKVIEFGGQNTPQFWNDWGASLMKLGIMKDEKRYYEMAAAKFEKALRVGHKAGIKVPQDIEWLYNLGCAYEFLGDFEDTPNYYEKSLQLLKRVMELEPTFHAVYFNLACVYSRLGELTSELEAFMEANKYFQKIISEDHEDDDAWNEWGVSLLNMAQLVADPACPEAASGYFAEAEKMFIQSAGLGNGCAIYHLACLYSLTGNNEASIYYLEKCVENDSLPPIEDLLLDERLENLRKTPFFHHFLSQF